MSHLSLLCFEILILTMTAKEQNLQKQLDALQQRCHDDHRELQWLRTAQAAPTFVVQRERKLLRFYGTEGPLERKKRALAFCAEVGRVSSCQLPAKLPPCRLEVRCRLIECRRMPTVQW